MRALAAGLAIVLLLTVVPVALIRLSGALPIDVSALSPEGLARPDDGALLLLILATIAWLSWAMLAVSVAVELVAALRGVPTPRIPGLGVPQRFAGALVTALLVGTIPAGASAGEPALATVDLAAAVLSTASDTDDLVKQLEGRAAGSSPSVDRSTQGEEPQPAELPTIVTQRHDTLWLLAEQHLGSGERFEEIVDLNRGQQQPDGRALGDDGRLYPGWTLRLPANADLQAPRPDRVVVRPGDTLWGIADEELHDPTRFHELADANRGDLQPDGERLRDAALILPGWVLEVPASSGHSPGHGDEGADAPLRGDGPDTPESDGASAAKALDGRGDTGSTPASSPDAGTSPGHSASPRAVESTPEPAEAGGSPSSRAPQDPPSRDGLASPQESAPDEQSKAGGSPRGLGAPGVSGLTPSNPATSHRAGPEAQPSESAHGPASDPVGSTASASEVPSAPEGPSASASQVPSEPGSTPTHARVPQQPDEAAFDDDSAGSDHLARSGDRAGFVLPAGGLAAALLLGAWGVELARRRVQFQRWRRPGERLPTPSARARDLEKSLMKGQTGQDAELLAAALGALAQAPTLAPVRVVEVGTDCVVVHLGEDWGRDDAPDPFSILAPGVLRATRERLRAWAGDPVAGVGGPALVTVGTRDEWTVLVDLGTVGTMRLAGDDVIVGEVLRAITAEVALDPRHRGSTRTLCLSDPRIADAAEPGDVIVDADPARVGRAVATALRRARGTSAGGGPAEVQAQSHSVPDSPGDEPAAEGRRSRVAVLETSMVIDLRGASGDSSTHDGVAVAPVACDARPPAAGAGPCVGDARDDSIGGDRASWDDWSDPFEIVVADRPIGVEVPPRSGVGLVSSAPVTGDPGITLSVLDLGRAVLVEDGIEFIPVGLTGPTVDDLVELFAATEVPGTSSDSPGATDGSEVPARSGGRADGVPPTGDVGAAAPALAAEDAPAQVVTAGLVPGAVPTVATAQAVATPSVVTTEPTIARERAVAAEPTTPGGVATGAVPNGAASRPEDGTDTRNRIAPVDAPAPRTLPETADHGSTQPTEEPGGDSPDRPGLRVPRLLLLGDVEVEHAQGRAESTRLGRLAETAAFVLLHPNARPSELLAALWPGRNANPQSCRQMISRTRSWLGRTDDGEPYLEPFAQTNGRLRLRPEVRSDWDDFQELADRGMADPDDVENLTAALELVRGRPFGSLWRRELAWADFDSHRMISRIVDVAYELAVRHEAAGRVREARAAVHRGMRTQVESELLDELLERLSAG